MKIKEKIEMVAALASILALGISIFTLIKVDRIADWRKQQLESQISVRIEEPSNGEQIDSFVSPISGIVTIRSSFVTESVDVGILLAQKETELRPFVYPLGPPFKWYAQPKLTVEKNGKF